MYNSAFFLYIIEYIKLTYTITVVLNIFPLVVIPNTHRYQFAIKIITRIYCSPSVMSVFSHLLFSLCITHLTVSSRAWSKLSELLSRLRTRRKKMINNILLILFYCTWGRLSSVSGQLCKVRPRGTWKRGRTRRTRWGPSRRRWSHSPLCPCRPTSTTHRSKASRILQVVGHNSRGCRTCTCHVFYFPGSPHCCVSVWWRLGDEREKWERHIAWCHHHIGLQTTFTRLRITQRGSTKYSWEK